MLRHGVARNNDDSLRAPLTSFEDADFSDEEVAEATLSAAGVPNTRRYSRKRPSLRALPWVLLGAIAIILLLSLPGGIPVVICALRTRNFDKYTKNNSRNITLVGLHGTEWPLPGNTLRALRLGAFLVKGVHMDISISKDGTPYVVDGKLEHTTSHGSGFACIRSSAYISKLTVNAPNHDPLGTARTPQSCIDVLANNSRVACTYRIPTLESVMEDLPANTKFFLQVDTCNPRKRPSECGTCSQLAAEVKRIALKTFRVPDDLRIVARSEESVESFRRVVFFSDVKFLLETGGTDFFHYAPDNFVRMVVDGRWDGVMMSPSMSAWRPDLGYAIDQANAARTTHKLLRFVKPVSSEWDMKVSTCSGARNLVVADTRKFARLLGLK